MGYPFSPLQTLHQQWRQYCLQQFEYDNPFDHFITRFGSTARFLHIGIEKNSFAASEPYAVFAVSNDAKLRVTFTIHDLLSLNAALTHPRIALDRGHENMRRQLAYAEENYRAHSLLIEIGSHRKPPVYRIAAAR